MDSRLADTLERRLSESQRLLLQAAGHETSLVCREVVTVSDCIKAEIEKLRQEVKRKALGLLGMIGLTTEDLAVWEMRQQSKGR